ncbi:hypothetical protein TNCV_2649291 [Trichonephila clavipes]|nr:hypothetical protein TNCV_2649291 [Trichonephila clavipes]
MVQAIQDDSTISLPVTEIVNIASCLSDEEYAVNHQDVRELVLGEETLDEEELMELIDAPTSNALCRAHSLKELRNCLAPSREVLVELEKKATIENQCEDEPSEEDILPIKRRQVRRLISDSEDEC